MIILLAALIGLVQPSSPDTRCYELRTYYAAPGKLDNLLARFRDHTTKLFEKHGITNIGYWVPADNKDNKLIYMISFPSREARDPAFKEFGADPEWQRVYKESESNGKLVDKIDSLLLTATDYSPPLNKPRKAPKDPALFELRIYKAAPGKLADLNTRFRDHTTAIFKKQGMVNFGYWTPIEKNQGADDTLVYLLIHKSPEAAAASWAAFVKDPDWIAARDASEKNGKLLDKAPDSTYLKATDFSPAK